jgi:prevent-host-death family protein
MRTVGAHEARTHFSRLLKAVADGDQITITKRGVPVAILQQLRSGDSPDAEEMMSRMREFRRGNRLDGLTIRELIDEGRR